jgi:PAS domain S-box-containing protein
MSIPRDSGSLQPMASPSSWEALVLANVHDAVIVTDLHGIVTFWNTGATRLFGWEPEEMLGQPLAKRFPSQLRPQVEEQLRALAQGQEWVGEWLDYRKDGTPIWIDARVSRFLDSQGKPAGLIGISQDITDRKRLEEERRQEQERYQALFLAIPEPCWVFDPGTLRLLAVNDAAVEKYGYSREELLRLTLKDLRPPEDVPRLVDTVARLGTGLQHSGAWRHRKRDGTVFYVEVTSHDVIFDGRPARIAVCLDITERRRVEEERRQLEVRAQQARRMESLSVLAGGIAHEFNNLLTGILGYTDLALGQLPVNSPLRPLLEQSLKSGRRAAELTQQMLAYAGKGMFVPRRLNFSELVREALPLLKPLLPATIELTVELTPNLPSIHADPEQVKQVILHLTGNATDALEGRPGRITLRTGRLTLSRPSAYSSHAEPELPGGEFVFLEVVDTGCGMTPETLQRIFDPFFTTKFMGRGLGLAAVHGIVRSHRGLIKVTSNPGAGTTFQVLLPTLPTPVEVHTVQPGTVLIVEGEASLRTLMSQVLTLAGYQVLTAATSGDGLTLVRSHLAQLRATIWDVPLTRQEGSDSLRELRQLAPHLPLLLLCSGAVEEAALRAQDLLDARLLPKPFLAADLLAAVHQLAVVDAVSSRS